MASEVSELTLTLTQAAAPALLPSPTPTVLAQQGDDVVLSIPLAPHSGIPTKLVWTRGGKDDPLVGERFSSSTQRGAVTLTVRNASVEDAGQYALTAHNDTGQARSDILLEVRTRPGDVPVFLRRLNDLAVKVGTRTRFLVEIRSPTQVKVSWEQEGKPVLEGERFHLLHEGNFFCVDVAPVTLEDAGLWMCRAHNSNGAATCFCHLNVLVPKAYKAPHFIEELVAILTEQGTVSLECKVVGVPTPTLKWFKDNQEIKAGDVFALSANPQDSTSLGTYTCEATNCMGKAYSTSKVHVINKEGTVQPVESLVPRGPPPVFSKELQNEKVKIGGKLTLVCKVKVPPWPKSISWFNKEGVVESGGRYHVMEDGLGAYSVEVSPVEATDEGQWKCVATSNAGNKTISTCSISVNYPKNYKKPKFLESLKAILTEEGLVSFECKVVGYPTPQLRWFKDGQELKPGDVYQLTGTNSLGSYCCIAKNCMGETSSTAELTVEDIQSQLNEEERLQLFSTNQPPSFVQGLKSIEVKINDPFRFTVQVSVSPQPTVSWYRDDEEVQDSDRLKKEQETKGVCHLSFKRLELADQAEWKCVATNDYGQSVTSCFLKLNVPRHYKKPRFLENLRAILSEEGAVNLECKVIGVPQPTLKWYKDGRELKPGDIHRIISGQDGTCCLGTYTCEATNCMGTVASSASLLGFEDRGQVKPPVPRPLPAPAPLVRQPSLSTIQEERTSQMHDTMTLDERAEVSFSFDGKEVSVSLYETPDLTEEEALQVVEMYAEELSEHISEHNIIELPPMRFVKETSKSGNLLMEAVVIDVSPDYYASAEDRTEADLDEFSITEDNNGFLSPAILSPEEMPFEKFTADFLERTLQALPAEQKPSIPIKPPRKRGAGADASDSSYHSFKEAKVSTPEEESSDAFLDALSSEKDKLPKESLIAIGSGTVVKEIPKVEEEKKISKSPPPTEMEISQEIVTKSSEPKKLKKKSRSRSKSTEIQHDESVVPIESKAESNLLNKRKSSDSEKEDDSLREFEKRKSLKMLGKQECIDKKSFTKEELRKSKSSESEKEDDSLQEYENRKSLSRSDKATEKLGKVKKHTSDESGKEDDSLIEYEKSKMSSDGSLEKLALEIGRPKFPLTKSMSTESSEKDDAFAIKSEMSEQTLSRKKRKKSVKKTGSLEKKDDGKEATAEIPPSSEAESYDREPLKHMKVISTSDLDRMRSMSDLESVGDKSRAHEEEDRSADFDTAEDSAYDKSEMSVLESLNHSIQEIQKGLAAVEEKIISESSEEPQSAKSSLSIIESLAQPINEIQKSLIEVERLAEETEAGHYSPSSILETLKEPIEELSKNLAALEQTQDIKTVEESLLKKTGLSLLEKVGQPLQELHKELSFIQQQAVIETGDETFSEILQSFKPSLLVVEGGMEQSERELSSKMEDLTDATSIPQPTYAHSIQDSVQSAEQVSSKQISSEKSDSVLPKTVKELEGSFADTIRSMSMQKEVTIKEELNSHSFGLETCMNLLKNRAQTADDNEIKDILISASNLITPLDQFKTVIERCLMLVVENDKSANPQVQSANIVLKSALECPVHALGNCIHLLETLAQAKSNQEVRGLGIKVLYKLSFPLEELKTTMKLVENLSEHTCIELLVAPVENLMATVSIINPEASKEGFAENISKEGIAILRELDLSLGNLAKSLSSMSKTLQPSNSLVSLVTLSKPLSDLQKNLHKLENKIQLEESQLKINKSETHSLAQDLCKPLQAIRTELSLAQHEIELDNFTNLSADVSHCESESPTSVVNQSLEQVYKNVLTCTEFILSKSPDETLHLRYLLFALNELIVPVNQLSSSIVRSEELFLKENPKLGETDISMQPVTSSVKELLGSLSSLQEHSSSFINQPEFSVVQAVCAMASPLKQVESGLQRIVGLMHEEDKQILNINMLKTLADPFKCLQKSMINISEKLESGLLSQDIFLELRQPIQELQRSILVIQDQVSFEYGDEPSSIESNIITLQSLVHPMNSLKKQFLAIESLLSEQPLSTSYSKGNKTLHSIIRVSHDLQLKVSSIMVQENYLSKHSLDSLDMFPIFQELSSVLRDFENSLKRVDLVSQDKTKPDLIFHNRLAEAVSSFKSKVSDLQNKILLASNKAIKDKKHPVHYLKKGTEDFLHKTTESLQVLLNSELDEISLATTVTTFFNNCSISFKELSNHLSKMENITEQFSFPEVRSGRDSTDISTVSSSDTIKDVNTIMEEITHSRISLELENIPFVKSPILVKELQALCEYLKTAEDVIVKNTVMKANSLSLSKEEERKALTKSFNGMKIQLGKVETYIHDNPQALDALRHLKYTLDVVQEHLTFGEEMSEMYILQNLSGPLKDFINCFNKKVDESVSSLKQTDSVSVYLERFEKSTSDLELGLMKLEHALLNSTGDFSSLKNIDIDVLAHPIEELVEYIHNIEEQSSVMSETLRDQSSLSMLKTLAIPIQEIKEGVLEIQEQILFESSGQPPSRKSCASILYEIAKPIRELRSGVALIQEQVVIMEADLEPLSDETAASSLKTLAVPIEELKKVLETFVEHRPIVFEPEVKSMSEDISLLKTIAQPVKELHSKLAAIEMNQLMEGNVESFSVKENVLALAKPIHVLQESIAQFENKIILETLGDDISVKTDISLIKRVAKPLLEVAKGIAMISEQQVVEAADLEDNTLSELSTLANITDVSMESAVLNVNQPIVLEQGLSLKEEVHMLKQAKATREDQFGVAVTEVQQVVCEAAETLEKSLRSKEKASMVVEESCSPLVVEQHVLSQIESFSIDSNSKQLAEVRDVTLHQALQAEVQEPISAVSQLTSNDESLTFVQEIAGSLNIAAQVDVQQAFSEDASFVNEISSNQPTEVKENIIPAYGIQGELQQSLADVESIETEEDTLKSISIQETSHKLEPLVQIQHALSIAETLSVTEQTLNVADVKTDLKEAIQNEAQQVMSVEGEMKSFDNISNTAASFGEITPQVATNVEMQQVMSTIENLETKKENKQIANASQVALAEAVLVEQQDLLSNIESLSELSLPIKQSQALSLEEARNVAVKTEVEEFISVAENIRKATEEIKAKIVFEPSLSEVAQSEIQKVLNFSNSVQSMKENLQLMSVEVPPLLKATQLEVQQVLTACKSIQTSLPLEMKTGIESEVEQIVCSAQNLETIQQSISAKLLDQDSILVQVGKEKCLPLTENVAQLQTQDQPKMCAEIVSAKPDHRLAVETEIQAFISVAESLDTIRESLKAKITSEPGLKIAVQQEIQQFLSAAEEVVAVKNNLEAKTLDEPSLNIATQAEIQQVMSACAHLESAKKALEAKSSTEQKFKAAIQSEIQQILTTTETLHEVQKGMIAKLSHVESFKVIEEDAQGQNVSAVEVIDNSSNICQADITTEVSPSKTPNFGNEIEKRDTMFEIIPPLTIQTQIDEFIEAANNIKQVSDALQAKAKIEPELKLEAIQEIQQISSLAETVQIVSHSLQAKTIQEPIPQQATPSEVQEVLDACEDLQQATISLQDKVNKDLNLQTAIQLEVQQILDTADAMQVVKKAFTATVKQEEKQISVSKTNETVILHQILSKPETAVPESSKTAEIDQKNNRKKDHQKQGSKVAEGSILPLEAVPEIISSDDVWEILTAVENLDLVSETLKSIISENPSLNEGLETHIQQIMLTSENLKAVKPALAKISSEPSMLSTVKLEIQQILIAEQSLNVIKDVLQAKSITEPQLQVAEVVLPQLLQSALNLQGSCERLQEKNLLDSKTKDLVDEKTITEAHMCLKQATQEEVRQRSTSTQEIQIATDSAEAICTQESSILLSAKKSSVASFIKKENSEEDVSAQDLKLKKEAEDKILEQKAKHVGNKETVMDIKETSKETKASEKELLKEECMDIKPFEEAKKVELDSRKSEDANYHKVAMEATSKIDDEQQNKLKQVGEGVKTKGPVLDAEEAKLNQNAPKDGKLDPQKDTEKPIEHTEKIQPIKIGIEDKIIKEVEETDQNVPKRKKSKDDKKYTDQDAANTKAKTVTSEKSKTEEVDKELVKTNAENEKTKSKRKESEATKVDKKDIFEVCAEIANSPTTSSSDQAQTKQVEDDIKTVKVVEDNEKVKPKEKKMSEGVTDAEKEIEITSGAHETTDNKTELDSKEVAVEKDKPKQKKSKDAKIEDIVVVDVTSKTEKLIDSKVIPKDEKVLDDVNASVEVDNEDLDKSKAGRKKLEDENVDKKETVEIINENKKVVGSKDDTTTELVNEEIATKKDESKPKKSKDVEVKDNIVVDVTSKTEKFIDSKVISKDEKVLDDVNTTVEVDNKDLDKSKAGRKKLEDENIDKKETVEIINENKKVVGSKDDTTTELVNEEIATKKDESKPKKSKDVEVKDNIVVDVTSKTEKFIDSKVISKDEKVLDDVNTTVELDNKDLDKSKAGRKKLEDENIDKKETVEIINENKKVVGSKDDTTTELVNAEIATKKDKSKQKKSKDVEVKDNIVVDVTSITEKLTESKVISKDEKIVDEVKTAKIDNKDLEESTPQSKQPKDEKVDEMETVKIANANKKITGSKDDTKTELLSEEIGTEKDKPKRKKSKEKADDKDSVSVTSNPEKLTENKGKSKSEEMVNEQKTATTEKHSEESEPERKKSKEEDVDQHDMLKAGEVLEEIKTSEIGKGKEESKFEQTTSEDENVYKKETEETIDETKKTTCSKNETVTKLASEEIATEQTKPEPKGSKTDDKEVVKAQAEQLIEIKEKVKSKEVEELKKVDKAVEKHNSERKKSSEAKVEKRDMVEVEASNNITDKKGTDEKSELSKDNEESGKIPKRKKSKEVKDDNKETVEPRAKCEDKIKATDGIVKTDGKIEKVKTEKKKSLDLNIDENEATDKSESKSKKQMTKELAVCDDFKISKYEKSIESSDCKEKEKISRIKSEKNTDALYENSARKPRKSLNDDNEKKSTFDTEIKVNTKLYDKKEIVDALDFKVKNQCFEDKFEERQSYKKSEVQTSTHRSRRQNRLYIDESSTSDYSSESCSESTKIKKSTSYDKTQWEKELLKKDSNDDSYSLSSSIQHPIPKKYERKAISPIEKTCYQRRETESKPLFCGRLVDRTAALGSKVKVTCSLVGKPEPTVQWYKDGLPLNTSEDLRLHTSLSSGLACLEISELKLGDAGRYTCMARNSHGEASTTASIKIFSYLEAAPQAPVFSHQIKDQYISASDELTVECRVKGFPQPSVSWYKDNQLIPARSRFQQTTLGDGTCRLVIHGPEASDSGQYKCVAENEVLSESISGYVLFEGRGKYLADIRSHSETKLPRFTNTVMDHRVREGGTVALQVAIKGTPRAEVTWYRGSEPLPKKSSRFRYLEDSSTGVYSLVMSDTSRTEAGIYTCRASNAHGYRDHTVKVEVVSVGSMCARGRPAMFVTRPDTSMSIAIGEDVSVSFRVSGDPKPQVTWMKNMKDITNNIRTLKETVNDYVRLSLKHANVMDAGTYFMMAKNVYGTDYAFVTVKVKQRARSLTPTGIRTLWSAPETSTILRDIHEVSRSFANELPGRIEGEATVSDSGKNWLSLTWAKPENRGAAPILAYRVEAWRLGSEGGAQWSELGITPINSFDAFFLQPGGEYKFRITPRNRYGWGESVTNSEPIIVGSASNFAPDIIRDLPGPVKALKGDSITLECEVAGDPRPDIEWFKDGLPVSLVKSLEDRVFVSNSQLIHRLIVKQLNADDSGRYVCEATNKLGKTSTYARLLVVSDPCLLEADKHLREGVVEDQELAPQFTMRLRDRRVQASYPVRLSCQVVGNPTPTVTWTCNNQTITSGKRFQLLSEADHFYTLEISPTDLGDIGEYIVTAQNHLGAVSCCCQLTVDKGIRAYIAPYFTSQLEPAVTVREEAELRLFAQVEAYPSVGIAWQKDGIRLRPSRRLVVTVDLDGRVELALAHVTSRDTGVYTCTASNVVGRSETSCQVNVTGGSHVTSSPPVITPSDLPYSQEPKFVVKPRSTEAVEGDTVIISCEVVGDPQPQVMWLRDWLKPDYYRDSPQFRQVAGGAGAQYTLEIPQVKLDFTGTYCVIARNIHGEAKAIISLQIYAKGQGKELSMVSGQVKHGLVETLPEIKRGLKDLRCCDGDSATLECLVSATPPPSVRWEKDGRILPLGEDVEAEVEGELARLRIRKVYPEDEGQYSCVAYNTLGRAVTSACLVVDVPEEKEHLLSQQLTRPTGFLSAHSTPRSTPRNTPSPARSITPLPSRFREFSSPSLARAKRIKMASPKFYTVPHNRIAEEGETVRFQCAVAGHPIPWASWDKDGHIVTPGARLTVTERDDLRTLELREVTVDDAGLYRVTLENEMGSIEATARLDVIGRQGTRSRSVRAWSGTRASPTFGRRLVGSAARVGGTFTLSCDVQASPSPVTSWYRNGEMVVMTERAVPSWDGRVARLELRDLNPEDGGIYTCVAENCVGTTQCAAELQVLEHTDPSDTDLRPPVFLQGLQSELTVEEGQPLELQTRLQGSSPLEVVWVKDGVEIPDCNDFRYVDYGDGRFGLRIADLFIADSGLYNCEAFNDHGDAITSGHLIVLDGSGAESPRAEEPEVCFTKTPSPVLAALRGNATFCARLQSRPLSHTSFTWSVGGHTVASDNDRLKVTTEEDSSILEVRDVQSEDFGPVTCVARVCSPGVPPSTVSCSTQLTLDSATGCPATLLRGPSDTTAMRGDRVLLKAIYRGNPEPSVRWLKAGRELQTEGRVQINSRDGVSCLTISTITADDSGKYVVSVENIHGADCHYASVAVEGPPEPPAGRPSVAAIGDAVTVAWSSPAYDGGCVLTGYQVEMRNSDGQDWRLVADRCHSLSHVVRGLEAGQTYVFRVRAENIHGASESSVESFPFTFHTPVLGSKEEESENCIDNRQVSLEPGEDFLLRYSVHEELGKGRYGVVNKVTDLHTGQTLAAKFVRCIKKQDREKVQEEIDIMNCLRHPKLLQLTAAFENPKDIVMVMEYISGGELFERVVADDFTLTERDCILFLRQICEGVSYMHKSHVVHLDLKPENIMCHTRTSHRIKIIDFGLAQKFESNTPVRVMFGTPEFIPPEIINYEPIGTESDMWSVGVICYVLLSGLSPFMGDNDAETFANITRADYDFDDEAFDAISQDAKDFISSLLVKRQEKRLTAEECLRHKWMTQCDTTMNCIKLSTDKLKKFIIRRKWQKTGNAIRALGRMATLSAASRRNSHTSSVGASPRASLATSRMSSLGEGEESLDGDIRRARVCSERSDSGISDCSSITARPLQHKKYSICEEPECESRYNPNSVTNKLCASTDLDITTDVSVTAKKRSTNSLRPFSETTVKAPSPTLQKDAKLFTKNDNFQKAFAFWKQ